MKTLNFNTRLKIVIFASIPVIIFVAYYFATHMNRASL